MNPTTRLDHADPLRLAFEATVTAHAGSAEAPTIVLDQSAFYPESGGQLGDRGTLTHEAGALDLLDVQVDDGGLVHHCIAPGSVMPAVGTRVHGDIARTRRRQHMALHTAQHMLSRALVDLAKAETVSARLGETACTVDVDVPTMDERLLARAEDLVNAVVDDDVAIRSYFPTPDELATLPLRRAPKVTSNIRVVDVTGFDVSPCGGTHCVRTSQVGLLRVTGIERYKGRLRIAFSAGPRARAELAANDAALRSLAQQLTCGPAAVGAAIERLRHDLTDARTSLGRARVTLAQTMGDTLVAAAVSHEGVRRVVTTLDDGDIEYLRAIGARITAHDDTLALLAAPTAEGLAVLITRGAKCTVDCGAMLKRIATTAGGRGGGRAERAEGRLPVGSDWSMLVAAG